MLWPRTIPPSRVMLPVAMKLLHETFGSSGERAPILLLHLRPPVAGELRDAVVGDHLAPARLHPGRAEALHHPVDLGEQLRVDPRQEHRLGLPHEPRPVHPRAVLPPLAGRAQRGLDLTREQVPVLEAPLARGAVDAQVDPAVALRPARAGEPLLLLGARARGLDRGGRCLRRGRGDERGEREESGGQQSLHGGSSRSLARPSASPATATGRRPAPPRPRPRRQRRAQRGSSRRAR